jgi:predicted GNAT superfamily acetyltransferase
MGDKARPAVAFVNLTAIPVGAVLALNNAHQVETSALEPASYGRLIDASGFAMAAGHAPDAFLIAFNDASAHDNGHLTWFRERHRSFYYVDRLIVAPPARGRGLALALYGALMDQARAEERLVLGCEINLVPPNLGSDALHSRLGFSEIGRRQIGDGKIVRYMRRDLS